MKLTVELYLGQHAEDATPGELTDTIRHNAKNLVYIVNILFERMGWPVALRSGWRPLKTNLATPNSALKSKHMTGEAVDIVDEEGEVKNYLNDHQQYLRDAGLWMEHPLATKGWVHLQIVPPKSGKQVFYP